MRPFGYVKHFVAQDYPKNAVSSCWIPGLLTTVGTWQAARQERRQYSTNAFDQHSNKYYLFAQFKKNMPLIYRVASNYQGEFAGINTAGENALQCRKIDLYRSIITVGNPSFLSIKSVRDFGFARALYDSIIKKVGIVASNIKSDAAGMRRHPIFETYVTDEKRIVSYNLGMAFAKLYSEKLLSITNLIHIEFLKKNML